jgi:hypothetical protein
MLLTYLILASANTYLANDKTVAILDQLGSEVGAIVAPSKVCATNIIYLLYIFIFKIIQSSYFQSYWIISLRLL